MYDINLKNVKKGKNIFRVFLIIGILVFVALIAILIYQINDHKKLDKQVMSSGTTVDSYIDDEGQTMYRAIYKYYVNGNEYTCSSSSSSSTAPSNKNATIYYESAKPAHCSTDTTNRIVLIISISFIIPVIFIVVGILNIKKVNKRIQLINELNKNGKLVKGLSYHLEPTGTVVNNVPIMKPVVEYRLPSGSTIILYGDPRHDKKTSDADGLVDLVIDENNTDNYFIDFEINRLSGNLPDDYYQSTTNTSASNNVDYTNDPNYQTISYNDLQNK